MTVSQTRQRYQLMYSPLNLTISWTHGCSQVTGLGIGGGRRRRLALRVYDAHQYESVANIVDWTFALDLFDANYRCHGFWPQHYAGSGDMIVCFCSHQIHAPPMSPICKPNPCRHPKLRHILTFKNGDEKLYRCLVCNGLVWSRELDRGMTIVE
jgi:hypothetical protein